ncbi:MAG: hypothetical protein LUC86_01010 [Prevotellaceae bacterium]|nr:hypothetical protein [Prevotellaceae bacterium]MCD8303397.1 hypothetical protein [Prevotellaceae bacterium]
MNEYLKPSVWVVECVKYAMAALSADAQDKEEDEKRYENNGWNDSSFWGE